MYQVQGIFITELDERIINEKKKRNRKMIDTICYAPASFSTRMYEKNHQNCQYSEQGSNDVVRKYKLGT